MFPSIPAVCRHPLSRQNENFQRQFEKTSCTPFAVRHLLGATQFPDHVPPLPDIIKPPLRLPRERKLIKIEKNTLRRSQPA
jgi:hypothetical protein